MIDNIVAFCQSKEEQNDWIQKISDQLENNCVLKTTSSKSVSLSLSHLSDYFAHLVCKGVITRSLLKLILYTQYINNIDTSKVVRRYANESGQLYSPCNINQSCSEENNYENQHNILNSYNNTSLRHCSSMVLKEDGKIIYGKRLLFTPIQTKACQDLTMSTLYKQDMNDHYNQHLLNYESNTENLKPKHLTIPLLTIDNKDDNIYLSDNRDSTYSLCDLKISYCHDNSCDYEKDTEISQDFQYFKFNDHNSLRSSDSGLADITIPVAEQSPLPPTETSSSNSEHLCKCSSLHNINSCIFEDDSLLSNKRSIPLGKGVTFRSELYAHWWLKKKLPGPADSCNSGKITIYI